MSLPPASSLESKAQLIEQAALTPQDLEQVQLCRRPHNRLGFAYQVGFVHLSNRFPAQRPFEINDALLTYIGVQVETDPAEIEQYAQRRETIAEHQGQIRRYLNLRLFEAAEQQQLDQFLFDACCRLEQTAVLRTLAEQFLKEYLILQPPMLTLDRLIGTQRRSARTHIFQRIVQALSPSIMEQLDDLLQVGDQNRSGLQPLKVGPSQPSPAALLRLTDKLEHIQTTGVLDLDLSWLNNNFQRTLAKYAQRSSAHKLREVETNHRYAALVCFLWQTYRDTIDHLVDMQDKLVNKVWNKAQKQCDEALQKHQQTLRRSVSMLHTLVGVVLDEAIEDEDVRTVLFRQIPKETLTAQIEASDEWLTGKHSHLFHGVVRRHAYVRQFFPALLQHLQFEGQTAKDPEVLQPLKPSMP